MEDIGSYYFSRSATPVENRRYLERKIDNQNLTFTPQTRQERYVMAAVHYEEFRLAGNELNMSWTQAIAMLTRYDDPLPLMLLGIEFHEDADGEPESVDLMLARLKAMGLPPSRFDDSEVTATSGPPVRVALDTSSDAWKRWKSGKVKIQTLRL